MMFFGFTNCGMVCPTTMAALNDMYKNLEQELPQDHLPAVVMVSVDPDRDTVARMNEYVTAFNSHFVGARAEMPQIETLQKELHLVAVKMQADGDAKNQYTINHSAEIMLFNPEGKLQAFMSYPHKADQMAKDYKAVLMAQTKA
jgi:protein SCO1/2